MMCHMHLVLSLTTDETGSETLSSVAHGGRCFEGLRSCRNDEFK